MTSGRRVRRRDMEIEELNHSIVKMEREPGTETRVGAWS